MITGRFVSLVVPDEEDYALVERWLSPSSGTAVLTGDISERVTAEAVRGLAESGKAAYFVITTRGGRKIGVVNGRRVGPEQNRAYTLGGAVGEQELWTKGFGAEGMALMIDYLFLMRNAHRVQFTTALYNKHITKLLTGGAGPVLEGVLRDYFYLDGRYHDGAMWSLLRHEWDALIAEADAPAPLVPEEDKATARRLLAGYLANGGVTALSQVLDAHTAAGGGQE